MIGFFFIEIMVVKNDVHESNVDGLNVLYNILITFPIKNVFLTEMWWGFLSQYSREFTAINTDKKMKKTVSKNKIIDDR